MVIIFCCELVVDKCITHRSSNTITTLCIVTVVVTEPDKLLL